MAFQRLDMKLLLLSQGSTRRPLACDHPVEKERGGGIHEGAAHDPAGWDGRWGDRLRAQTRLGAGMKKHASGAARMSRGAWEGSERHFTWQSQRPAALSRIRYQNIRRMRRPGQIHPSPSPSSPSRQTSFQSHDLRGLAVELASGKHFIPRGGIENCQRHQARAGSPLSICPPEPYLTRVKCRAHSHQHAANCTQ